MNVVEGVAVYLAVGLLGAIAYTLRALLIDRRIRRKRLNTRSHLLRVLQIVLLWPLAGGRLDE